MSFALEISKWAEKAGEDMVEFQRAVILSLFNAVILDTPVDSGRLRGNWVISSDAPAKGTFEVLDPTGASTLLSVSSFVAKLGAENVNVFLTNNLPYAYRIEYDGWSHTKAPEGMVRKNYIRISQNLKNA